MVLVVICVGDIAVICVDEMVGIFDGFSVGCVENAVGLSDDDVVGYFEGDIEGFIVGYRLMS